jgi:predicted HTH transcriptional regulator
MNFEPLPESTTREYKAAFCWNRRSQQADGNLRKGTLKSVAAFLNTEGGELWIGVADDLSTIGLADELEALTQGQDLDQFQNLIEETLYRNLFPLPLRHVEVGFVPHEGHLLCRILVRPMPGVTYVKEDGTHAVYVRTGNRTLTLHDLARDEFIASRMGGRWTLGSGG